MICSIRGVPRMIQIKVRVSQRSGANRHMEPKHTTSPSGSAAASVPAKMTTVV